MKVQTHFPHIPHPQNYRSECWWNFKIERFSMNM